MICDVLYIKFIVISFSVDRFMRFVCKMVLFPSTFITLCCVRPLIVELLPKSQHFSSENGMFYFYSSYINMNFALTESL